MNATNCLSILAIIDNTLAVQCEPGRRPDTPDECRAAGQAIMSPTWRRKHAIDYDRVERLIRNS